VVQEATALEVVELVVIYQVRVLHFLAHLL
jgi:hypothetical protein